jgi:hypothetical protein
MTSRHDFHKAVIGRSELLKFVDADIINVAAKTDTGAYRSSIHASSIVANDDGSITFKLLGGHPLFGSIAKDFKSDEYKKVTIANSFGHKEVRYEVDLKVKLGSKVFKAKFTLADRSKKIYPILIGRELINHRFIVDPGESGIDRELLLKDYDIKFPPDEEEGR